MIGIYALPFLKGTVTYNILTSLQRTQFTHGSFIQLHLHKSMMGGTDV